jgi:hypothetical protein
MNGRREIDFQGPWPEYDKPNYGYTIGAVLGGLLSLAVGLTWIYFKPEPMPTGVHEIATPAPEVAKVPTEWIDLPPIEFYQPEAKKKLRLPDSVQKDTHAHVIASTKTANDERQHTITTLVDDQTGEATTYDRVDPLPWLAVNTKSQVGAFYGIKNGQQTIRIQGEQEFLQIKALHVGVMVSADVQAGNVDTFAGVGLWARW